MSRFSSHELEAWSGGRWEGDAPDSVSGIVHDSRAVAAGDLFVAIRGPNFDGHAYVDEALARGACAAMVETGWSTAVAGRPLLRVANPRSGLQGLAQAYRRKVNPRVVGVTGSAGKTSVKDLIASLLGTDGKVTATRGNWNNDLGLPLSMLRMDADVTWAVFEVGTNHPGEIAALCDILEPDWGVLTNVGPVHIEFFGSMDAIVREKSALLEALPSDGLAFLDERGGYYDVLRSATEAEVVTVALDLQADYEIETQDTAIGDVSLCERASGDRFVFQPPAPGAHQLVNTAMAVAVARRAGLSWPQISEGLSQYRLPPMRWQHDCVCGVCFINDAYNANPLSMKAALSAFSEELISGSKWLVLGDMLELGSCARREHEALGAEAAKGPWAGIFTMGQFGAVIVDGARREGFDGERLVVCRSHDDIAKQLDVHVKSGDAVLLKGSRGMKLETVILDFKLARENAYD